jgi:TP901 family phage tail tape measure protein
MSLLGNIWVKLGLKSDDFQRGMDNAERKSKTFGETMRGITTKVMAAVAAFKMLAGTLKTITNFEAAQSKLAAVLGTTVDKMQRLTDSAIELGRKTQYTASEVTGLQTELAKLGFAEPEILSMQEAVLKFAAAVGTDLPSAAARAGATMRGFGLTAEETSHMLEVMAVSTSKSALSFNYLDSTLGKLVPVTRSFGLNTEATISLLGTLANAGIDASSAGTALRNILIQLSDKSSKLNQAIGKQPQTMEELIEAFQTLRDKHIDLGQAQELVDKRSASVLLSLMNNADACSELYGELNNTNGALDEMYDTMTHNVAGAVAEVKSAWEGFVLSLRGSTGILYTVLTNVRDLIGELNYAMFMGTKQSTETANAYDKLKRTIAETADPVAALDIAYKQLLADANAEVGRLENKSALGRLLNHDSLDEARAKVDGLQAAYKQLRGELTRPAKAGGGGAVDTGDQQDPFSALLDSLNDGKAKDAKEGLEDVTRAAREYAQELAEINAYDDEMAAQADAMYDAFKKESGAVDEVTQSLIEMNNAQIAAQENTEKFKAKIEDLSEDMAAALRSGIISALGELAEAIGTGEWDTSTMVRALLNPLADAAISAGTIILTTGEALEALRTALADLFGGGPEGAAIAGAALIAVGMAAKAGLAAIATSGNKGSGGNSNGYNYTGGYGVTPATVSNAGPMEIEGTVTVKGQDIQIALDNYNRNRRR